MRWGYDCSEDLNVHKRLHEHVDAVQLVNVVILVIVKLYKLVEQHHYELIHVDLENNPHGNEGRDTD